MGILKRLWNDDRGAVVSVEYVMVTGLAVGAAGSGVVAVRNAAIKQSEHLAETISATPYIPTPDELRRQTALPGSSAPTSPIQSGGIVIVVQNFNTIPPSP